MLLLQLVSQTNTCDKRHCDLELSNRHLVISSIQVRSELSLFTKTRIHISQLSLLVG